MTQETHKTNMQKRTKVNLEKKNPEGKGFIF